MDFSPDGHTLFVRTYMFGYTWEREEGETWSDVLDTNLVELCCLCAKNNVQGETVFFDNYGEYIYLMSENKTTSHPVYKIKRNRRKYIDLQNERPQQRKSET